MRMAERIAGDSRRMHAATAAAAVLVLASACCSCLSLKPASDGVSDQFLPPEFGREAGEDAEHPNRWWEDFGSEELSRLIRDCLAGNLTLAAAEARFKQAAAVARKAGAVLVPEVSLTSGAGVTRSRQEAGGASERADGDSTHTVEDYSLGLAASYELDLWGRVRSGRRSALELAGASRDDMAAAAMSLAAQTADRWLRVIEQRAQLDLLHRQIETNRAQLELIELRRRKGLATALDVYQQEQVAAAAEALVPLAEGSLEVSRHALAVLLGKPPRTDLDIMQGVLPDMPDAPSPGLPADLLARRPDVRAAWRRLESAGWEVAAARAERLPAIRITGSASYRADELNTVFDNWLVNLAAGLTAPVVDGRRRRAEVDRTAALRDERLAQYGQAVLTAVREVEDALVQEDRQQEHLAALEAQLRYAEKALDEAHRQYRKGRGDYLRVLLATASAQNLERLVLQARRERLSLRIALYRALGGSWMMEER